MVFRAFCREDRKIEKEIKKIFTLICPICKGKLQLNGNATCISCGKVYTRIKGFLNFTGLNLNWNTLSSSYKTELQREDRGTILRTQNFYLPLIERRFEKKKLKILDSGCGTGGAVEELRKFGHEAYGIDIQTLRADFWGTPDHFFFADGCFLPFPDESFDVVISFGVLEHIERNNTGKGDNRQKYISENLRVLKKGGIFIISFPNGAFPIDFWHGGSFLWGKIKGRFHLPYRDFLPTFREVKRYLKKIPTKVKARSLSPYRHLQFKAATEMSPILRRFTPLMKLWLLAMKGPWENFITRTPLNPFVVITIQKL